MSQRQKKSGSSGRRAKGQATGKRGVSTGVHNSVIHKLSDTTRRLQLAHMIIGAMVHQRGDSVVLEALGTEPPWELEMEPHEEKEIAITLKWR